MNNLYLIKMENKHNNNNNKIINNIINNYNI